MSPYFRGQAACGLAGSSPSSAPSAASPPVPPNGARRPAQLRALPLCSSESHLLSYAEDFSGLHKKWSDIHVLSANSPIEDHRDCSAPKWASFSNSALTITKNERLPDFGTAGLASGFDPDKHRDRTPHRRPLDLRQ
ncbi:hypothetical protein Efla_007536 [Eimeria flavescens]